MSDALRELQQTIRAAREEIDRIDGDLVRLLNRRAAEVVRIGRVKRELDEPIYQPDREEEIFGRIATANEGPLENDAIRRLFERILDEARRLERAVERTEG